MSNASDRNDHFVAIETSQPLGKPAGAPSGLHCGMDPPTYEEAINPSITPPPSYESLFGRVKEAQKSSKGVLDFIKNLFVLLLGSIGCTVILICTVVVPIAMVVMGSLYMYQCPQGENIPVYLLVGGLLGIFKEVLHLSVRVRKTVEEIDAERVRYNPAHTLLFWLMVGWFILGSFWVYELYEPNYDPGQGPYCNKTLYLFAYWLITSIYICLGFTTLCVCSLAVTTFWLCPELPRWVTKTIRTRGGRGRGDKRERRERERVTSAVVPTSPSVMPRPFDERASVAPELAMFHHTSTKPGKTGRGKEKSMEMCQGCQKPIKDRYLLNSLGRSWHEDCLKCSCCEARLGEVGESLYTRANLILCKRDYLRIFGSTGFCSACSKIIPAFEFVMRAKTNVYHLDCFACQLCSYRFCVGDRFYLSDNKILCETDYNERIIYSNNPRMSVNSPGMDVPTFRPLQMSEGSECNSQRGLS